MKVFGITLDEKIARSDRPYVFVKIETNQGVVGWGEATLEGKAAAAMACVNDLHDFIVGSDPMQSEHLYQLMYIGSFYRGGPVLGSAISGIDQAIWDIRGKVLGVPVYQLLGGPIDARGVRGYYHAQAWTLDAAKALGDETRKAGVTALKFQLPDIHGMDRDEREIDARGEIDGNDPGGAGTGYRFCGGLSCEAESERGFDHCEGDRAAAFAVR